jgi:hypothetical protein
MNAPSEPRPFARCSRAGAWLRLAASGVFSARDLTRLRFSRPAAPMARASSTGEKASRQALMPHPADEALGEQLRRVLIFRFQLALALAPDGAGRTRAMGGSQ